MKKITHYSLLVFSFLVLLTGCSQDVFDEYYERPENLEPPIYQQLEGKGNFKNLLALIQKAKYKDILSKAGYWTMMAPNDDAFTQFFQKEGISDVTKIDSVMASKIVKYALVYNAFRLEQLSDYQSPIGWEVDNSFRRRTAFYDGFLNKTVNGKPMVIVGSNRNNRGAVSYYVNGDNNNKYLSYFEKEYFTTKNLSNYDYNFFYPNSNFTNANVLGGHIEEADIIAENGVIHEVSQVSLPLMNLDQYLESNPNYSLFRSIVENNLVSYNFNQDATTAYRNYTGKSDQVFVKVYDPTLAFSPNNENYLKQSDNDGQMDAYTLFVPENAALQQFINTILLKNYPSIDKLPKYIFQDLVNAHMVPNAVWPSKAASYNNALGEEIRFNFATDVKDAKVTSNGFFYGTSKIQESNLFYTVYTSAYLDPKFTLATRLFNDGSGFREIVSDISQKYTLFLPSDAVLRSLGYDFNINRNEWTYTNPVTQAIATASIARSNLMRVLYNGIIPTPNGELNNLASSGIIRSGDLDIPGEYIKWNNNKVFAAGNTTPANVIGFEDKRNGRTYYIDKLIQFSEEAHGLTLKKLATANTNFSHFYNYLAQSTLYKIGDWIEGVEIGTSYTFVVPSNAAISQAVKDGVLPGTVATGVPNFNPALQGDKDLVADFLRYHIIATKTVSDDGLSEGLIETLRKDTFGEKTFIQINSAPGTLSFKDSAGRTANFIKSSSNNLADRTLIHLVDNYLLYKQ